MRLARKAVCFLFLFVFIFPLYAKSPADVKSSTGTESSAEAESQGSPSASSDEVQQDQDSPLVSSDDAENNEPFIFEELFIFEEAFFPGSLIDGNTLPDTEANPDEENFLSDETVSDEENLLSTEASPDEEAPLGKATLPNEEDTFTDDDDAVFFEAPPLVFEAPTFEIRSFDTVFPGFSWRQKAMIMSPEGFRNYFVKNESPMIVPNPDLGINIIESIMKRNPSHLIETLMLVPYNGKAFDLLDIYNALGRIEKIKDYSVLLNGNDFYVFTESTRIESNRSRKAVPDPLPAVMLPFSETMYLRLKEFTFGNLFLRGEISISLYGITYSMTNFADVRYFLIPIMKTERFSTILYLEPVKEGLLIYSVTGFYLPGFIADRVNLTPNINRRIEIFFRWITDGLKEQKNAVTE